jgi:hypothetical protein
MFLSIFSTTADTSCAITGEALVIASSIAIATATIPTILFVLISFTSNLFVLMFINLL